MVCLVSVPKVCLVSDSADGLFLWAQTVPMLCLVSDSAYGPFGLRQCLWSVPMGSNSACGLFLWSGGRIYGLFFWTYQTLVVRDRGL